MAGERGGVIKEGDEEVDEPLIPGYLYLEQEPSLESSGSRSLINLLF